MTGHGREGRTDGFFFQCSTFRGFFLGRKNGLFGVSVSASIFIYLLIIFFHGVFVFLKLVFLELEL